MKLDFVKMHGLGNDFIIFDARDHAFNLSENQIIAMSNRRLGIGCDQLIVMEAAPDADVFMRIYNADGSEVSACGNASRCVASLLCDESGRTEVTLQTRAGILPARSRNGIVAVNMGIPKTGWQDIPLAHSCDTAFVKLDDSLSPACAISIGNPHAVFFAPDVMAVPLAEIGAGLEHHTLFPERANIEFVEIIAPDTLRMRVWERGAGITPACGTGACASFAAARRRGLIASDTATIILDGGNVTITRDAEGALWLAGDVAMAFSGTINID